MGGEAGRVLSAEDLRRRWACHADKLIGPESGGTAITHQSAQALCNQTFEAILGTILRFLAAAAAAPAQSADVRQ